MEIVIAKPSGPRLSLARGNCSVGCFKTWPLNVAGPIECVAMTTPNASENLNQKYPEERAIHLRPWATPSIVVGRATSHKRVGANAGQYPSPDPRRLDWPNGEGRVSTREIATRLPINSGGPNVPTTVHSARPNLPTLGWIFRTAECCSTVQTGTRGLSLPPH